MKRTKQIWACTTGLALLGATVFLGGRGPKRGRLAVSTTASVVAEQDRRQDTVMHDDIKLSFGEAQSSCEDLPRSNVSDYPPSKYIDTVVDEDSKAVMLIWPLDNAAAEKDDVRYANGLIRAFNDACAEQDFSVAASSEESYGDLYQKCAVNIQMFREMDILKPDRYLVSMTIPADSNQAVIPFSQYDGVNEVILTGGNVKVPNGKYTGDRTGLYNGE